MNIAARERYIARQAQRRGLDPKAVLAIVGHEGGSGGVGDGGHAFGPFQLNDAGGVLTNAPANQHSNAWAWSNAGINFALNRIQQVAQGLHGRAAVTAIATRFERPANVQAEISDAMAHYGGGLGAGQVQGAVGPAARGSTMLGAGTRFDQATFAKQAGLLMLQNAQAAASGQLNTVDIQGGLEAARRAATLRVQAGSGQPVISGKQFGGGAAGKAVAIASKQIGLPYVWGGESRSTGFDCSGLVQFAYGHMGIKLPRTAAEQGRAGRAVSYGNLRPGDLLVENNGDHVVMYAGNGKVIQAPHTGEKVQYSPVSWFPSTQYHARRIVG